MDSYNGNPYYDMNNPASRQPAYITQPLYARRPAYTTQPANTRQPAYFRQSFSYLRLLHAAPDTQSVDVYANNSLIASGLTFRGFTEYLQLLSGSYNIKIFPAGTTGPVLLDTVVEIPVQSIMTAVVIGLTPNISIKTFYETVVQIPAGRLYLRFANLVPNSPEMDLVLSDGTKLFEEVAYGTATNYVAVPANTYIFYLQQSNTNRSLLYVPNIQLQAGRFYTIYAVGMMEGSTPLQVLVPLDGNSYIQL